MYGYTPVPAGNLNVGQTAKVRNHGHTYIGAVSSTTAEISQNNNMERFTLVLKWKDLATGDECSAQLSCRLDDYADLIE